MLRESGDLSRYSSVSGYLCSHLINTAVSTSPPALAVSGIVKAKVASVYTLPSLACQPLNTQPLSGLAVTAWATPPLRTSWLVSPASTPLPCTTNSKGTLASRTAMGSSLIRLTGTPTGLGMLPSGWGRRSSVI